MRRAFLFLAVTLCVSSGSALAQYRAVPGTTPTWFIQSVSSWNQAVAQVIEHDGNETVAFPTGVAEWPYIVAWRSTRPASMTTPPSGVLKRATSSSSIAFDANFNIGQYNNIADAYSAFTVTDPALTPRLITMGDHEFLVFALKPCGDNPSTERRCN